MLRRSSLPLGALWGVGRLTRAKTKSNNAPFQASAILGSQFCWDDE